MASHSDTGATSNGTIATSATSTVSSSSQCTIDSLPSLPPIRCIFIDNYDSYSYNLVHLLAVLSGCAPVVRFNTVSREEIQSIVQEQNIDCIVISPGPGNPERSGDFGVCEQIYLHSTLPILGICLGLQGQCSVLGGKIVEAKEPRHGRLSTLKHDGKGLFEGVDHQVKVVRYNSLVVDPSTLHDSLEVSAWAVWDDLDEQSPREIMGIRRRRSTSASSASASSSHHLAPRESVQFHPESICTEGGRRMMWNWFRLVEEWKRSEEQRGVSVKWNERDVHPAPSIPAALPSIPPSAPHRNHALLWKRLSSYIPSDCAFIELYGSGEASSDPSCYASSTAASAATSTPPRSTFWLDSSKVEAGRSRWSFMGDSAGPLSFCLGYDVRHPRELRLCHSNGRVEMEHLGDPKDVWKRLENLLDERSADVVCVSDTSSSSSHADHNPPFPFECGFVGSIGYAMKQLCEPDSLPPLAKHFQVPNSPPPAETKQTDVSDAASSTVGSSSSFRPPDLSLLFSDRMIIWDHAEAVIYAACLCNKSDAENASVDKGREWIQQMDKRVGEIATSIANLASSSRATSAVPNLSGSAAASIPLPDSLTISTSWFHTQAEYIAAIHSCLDAIKQGESYEICLTNQLDVRVELLKSAKHQHASTQPLRSIRPLDYYLLLRRVNPAAYAGFFSFSYTAFSSLSATPTNSATPYWNICSSSPERFVQVSREGVVESKPIKGTLARGATPELDTLAIKTLSESKKDFAENLMIVDLLRNDLGRVCQYGSVEVPKLMEVESYATVHNLVSTIRGKLSPGNTVFGVLQASFPPGSMTGAPKLRTCQILKELEREPDLSADATTAGSSSVVGRTRERGIYSGNLGYISLNGGMSDLNVVIRTALVRETQTEHTVATEFTIGAGGAIVYLSDPQEEYAEILLKVKALLNAIQLATQEVAERIERLQ